MSNSTDFSIKVTSQDGAEDSKLVGAGTTVADIQPSGSSAFLNGNQATGAETLRAGDHVEFHAPSGKAGA